MIDNRYRGFKSKTDAANHAQELVRSTKLFESARSLLIRAKLSTHTNDSMEAFQHKARFSLGLHTELEGASKFHHGCWTYSTVRSMITTSFT